MAEAARNSRRPMFQRSADADTLIRLMEKATVGQMFTYEAMNRAIGRAGKVRPACLSTALHHLGKAHGLGFQTVKGEGVRRASDAELVDEAHSGVPRKMKAVTRWAGRRLALVTPESLDADHLPKYHATGTLGAILRQAALPGVAKRIHAQVMDSGKPLPLAIALKLIE